MTDTEGAETRQSDGEETQFIQPIRDYGRAEAKPLDLPRATIGGYRADAVERRVAELERRRTLDQAEIIRLKRENHGRQTENGELNQRLTMLQEQNKKLEYQASNPYEHIGVDMQNMVNGAKAERKAILDKAETEAKTILGKAHAKAEAMTGEAKKKADEQVEQATRCKQEIDQEADRRIGESRERAQKLLSDANTEADTILKAAEAKAARLDAETKTRVADADRREREAARTVDQARRLLADAAAPCRNSPPRTPANRIRRPARESETVRIADHIPLHRMDHIGADPGHGDAPHRVRPRVVQAQTPHTEILGMCGMQAEPPIDEQLQRVRRVRRPTAHLQIPQAVGGEQVPVAGRDPVRVSAVEREPLPHDRPHPVHEPQRARHHAPHVMHRGRPRIADPARPPPRRPPTRRRVEPAQQARGPHRTVGEPVHHGEQPLRIRRTAHQTRPRQRHAERIPRRHATRHTGQIIHREARHIGRDILERKQRHRISQTNLVEQGQRQIPAFRLHHPADTRRDRHTRRMRRLIRLPPRVIRLHLRRRTHIETATVRTDHHTTPLPPHTPG